MIAGWLIVGSALASVMVWTPPPAMLKSIVCTPAALLESVIACRKEPEPASLVFVTVKVVNSACWQAENSDVLFKESVAVAVTTCPEVVAIGSVALNEALPEASVVTDVEPRKTSPSPLPEDSHDGLEKNSTEKA